MEIDEKNTDSLGDKLWINFLKNKKIKNPVKMKFIEEYFKNEKNICDDNLLNKAMIFKQRVISVFIVVLLIGLVCICPKIYSLI